MSGVFSSGMSGSSCSDLESGHEDELQCTSMPSENPSTSRMGDGDPEGEKSKLKNSPSNT